MEKGNGDQLHFHNIHSYAIKARIIMLIIVHVHAICLPTSEIDMKF